MLAQERITFLERTAGKLGDAFAAGNVHFCVPVPPQPDQVVFHQALIVRLRLGEFQAFAPPGRTTGFKIAEGRITHNCGGLLFSSGYFVDTIEDGRVPIFYGMPENAAGWWFFGVANFMPPDASLSAPVPGGHLRLVDNDHK